MPTLATAAWTCLVAGFCLTPPWKPRWRLALRRARPAIQRGGLLARIFAVTLGLLAGARIGLHANVSACVVAGTAAGLLASAAAQDAWRGWLPYTLTVPALLLACSCSWLWLHPWWSGVTAAAAAGGYGLVICRAGWLGEGDVPAYAAVGALVGWPSVAIAVPLSIVLLLPVCLIALLRRRRGAVPFGAGWAIVAACILTFHA